MLLRVTAASSAWSGETMIWMKCCWALDLSHAAFTESSSCEGAGLFGSMISPFHSWSVRFESLAITWLVIGSLITKDAGGVEKCISKNAELNSLVVLLFMEVLFGFVEGEMWELSNEEMAK